MTDKERFAYERELTGKFNDFYTDTDEDLRVRVNGVATRAGATGYQFVGYTRLERFYRGDQWDVNEAPGASQRTDNYCAVVVDNMSSLIFDEQPEISCPVDDPSDKVLAIKAEIKENLIKRVYDENESEVEFDEWAKVSSLYGDGFMKGPWVERVDENGDTVANDDKSGSWKIRFAHVENSGSIRPIFADTNYKKIIGFIEESRLAPSVAERIYGKAAKARGIKLVAQRIIVDQSRQDADTMTPLVPIQCYWDSKVNAVFYNKQLIDYWIHNWNFVPLEHVKNTHTPNHPFGKSDIEDVIDPQVFHNRVNNDLANLISWVSTQNFWGKNLEGMQALVAGLSRIYSLPEDGELHGFEKAGDPYVAQTFAAQRRNAILDISGNSEAMMSSSQLSVASGRALAVAFQGTMRKVNPRLKRFQRALQSLNANIFKLYEKYFPETKVVIGGDWRNNVYLKATLLRNIVDTINKFQSGLISQTTAMREVGVNQPKLEQKLMIADLEDPVLGKQVARQPSLLPMLNEGENAPGGGQPMPGPGARYAGPAGAVTSNNQQASGAAPTPTQPQ